LTETEGQNKVASVKRDVQLTQTTFFKYAFLNRLRDEVGLTLSFQKVTLFHLLCVVIPAAGLGAGSAWGTNLSQKIIGGSIGLAIGIAVSWPLPKLFCYLLCMFVRKGWFLRTEPLKSVPVMTSDEFIARSKVFQREEVWPLPVKRPLLVNAIFFLVVVSGALGIAYLCKYMDSVKPKISIQVLAGFGILVFIGGCIFLCVWMEKRLWKKLGLLCPACGREITDAAGLSRIPYLGLCKHCGTKIVEIKI
jgi:hypothetical protein